MNTAAVTEFKMQSQEESAVAEQAKALLAQAQQFQIQSDEDMERAVDMISQVRKHSSKVENTRKELVAPIKDAAKNIDQRFKVITVPLVKAEELLRGKVHEFRQYKEEKRREAEREMQRQQEAARRQAEEDARRNSPPPGDVVLQPHDGILTHQAAENLVASAPPAVKEGPILGATGAKGDFRKVWKFEVVDKAALFAKHPELLLPDEKTIRQLVTSGIRDLPGVRVFQTDELVVR